MNQQFAGCNCRPLVDVRCSAAGSATTRCACEIRSLAASCLHDKAPCQTVELTLGNSPRAASQSRTWWPCSSSLRPPLATMEDRSGSDPEELPHVPEAYPPTMGTR